MQPRCEILYLTEIPVMAVIANPRVLLGDLGYASRSIVTGRIIQNENLNRFERLF